jgi:hypothetical protein
MPERRPYFGDSEHHSMKRNTEDDWLDGQEDLAGEEALRAAYFVASCRATSANQLLMNDSRSGLMTSAWVVHIPCDNFS